MRNEITAEWARKNATTIIGEGIKNQINLCLDKIEAAVKQNKMNCDLTNVPDTLTISELNKRGFTTKVCGEVSNDPREGQYLNISW